MAEEAVVIDEATGEIIPPEQLQQDPPAGEGGDEGGDGGDGGSGLDSGDEDDHPTGSADTELAAAKTEEEKEAIRESRRQERKDRKTRAREREDNLRNELAGERRARQQLEERLTTIERRSNGSELAQVDADLQKTQEAYAYFKDQVRVASDAKNGSAVAEATDGMLKAQVRFSELQRLKKAIVPAGGGVPRVDPLLMQHAQGWMSKNAWYDPRGGDSDSRIALEVDRQMGEEGWQPTTPEYWNQLTERLKKYLPHRFKAEKPGYNRDNGGKPRVPVTGSDKGGASTPGLKKGYRLSADRVQALKEANLWEDPKSRAEAIKRYRDYDAEHAA